MKKFIGVLLAATLFLLGAACGYEVAGKRMKWEIDALNRHIAEAWAHEDWLVMMCSDSQSLGRLQPGSSSEAVKAEEDLKR